MYKFIKRFLDILISSITIIIVAPLFLPVMLILRFTGEGYIFYRQERIGFRNEKFYILKFATMLKDSPNLGTGSLTLKNDPRVFPFGKFLRATKLNELPQLINIFKGDMSIVGPRPQMEVDFLKFPDKVQRNIYNVKPGLTGTGAIVFRNEESILSTCKIPPHEYYKNHIAPFKGELELWYQEHMSLLTDLLLVLSTIWVLFSSKISFLKIIFKTLPKNDRFI